MNLENLVVKRVKKNPYSCELLTDSDLRMKVGVVNEETFSIAFIREENEEESSRTILEDQIEGADYEVEENAEYIRIWTSGLGLNIARQSLQYTFTDGKGKAIISSYAEPVSLQETGAFKICLHLQEEECLYGLGEDNDVSFGRLNRRGSCRDMVTGQRINRNRVTADYPIPFLLSLGGRKPYAIYVDNTYRLTVDLGKTVGDCLSISAEGGPCKFYFFGGETIPQIHKNYMKLIGMPKLPPLWTLGYMQSKCSFQNWEELDDVLYRFKEAGIPIDSIVFDFDWAEFFNNYKWHPRWQGLSPEKIKYYRQQGIHFMASNSGPMLKKNADTFESALEAGVLARDEEGNTVTCGHYSGELIDFTNPATEAWMEPQLNRIMEDGIEGWWLDLTEPEGDSKTTVYHAGKTDKIHNLFSNYTSDVYHRIMEKYAPGKRSFILTRTGAAGIQNYPTAVWTGDVYSEYGTLEAHVPEALNTGLSGIPMWTSDTGGFISVTGNDLYPYNLYHNDMAEHSLLFERWMQFSCFTPMMRAHHAGGESVPFSYTEIMVNGMRHYIELRYQLLPYIYTAYYESFLNGIPIMRPMFWHYPEDKNTYSIKDQYLFGEWLLVAPVIKECENKRMVYLPEGIWYDWDYGYEYEGGSTIEVYAPQNRIPVLVKAGAILPMVKGLKNTDEMNYHRMEVQIYPSVHSEYTMYADDGRTTDYLEGKYTKTYFVCKNDNSKMLLSITRENDLYATKEFILHVHTNQIPEAVRVAGKPLRRISRYYGLLQSKESAYCYDEFKQLLDIRILCDDVPGIMIEVSFEKDRALPKKLPFMGRECAGQLPYVYPASNIPCKIPVENYDRGGEGIAYHKVQVISSTVYREDNAGIEECVNNKGHYYMKDLSRDEWLEYSVICNTEGEYKAVVGFRGTAEISIAINSQIVSGYIKVASEDFTEVEIGNINIAEGEQVLRIRVHEGQIDFNKLSIVL